MNLTMLDRRTLIWGAAAAAAILPLRQATAQAVASGGDWFAMVKSQHALIATALQTAIADAAGSNPRLATDLENLGYLLTAHSVAEENVLYPALAVSGFPVGSGDLYLEQQAQKVLNAKVTGDVMDGVEGSKLVEDLEGLQAIILEHAKEHEEGELYPRLQAKLSAQQNSILTELYAKFFAMVKPA